MRFWVFCHLMGLGGTFMVAWASYDTILPWWQGEDPWDWLNLVIIAAIPLPLLAMHQHYMAETGHPGQSTSEGTEPPP